MKVYFCTTMFPDIEDDIKKSKAPNTVSGHHFQNNLIEGFEENECDVKVINIPRLRKYPDYPQIIFRKKFFSHKKEAFDIHLGFINLFGLNFITQTINEFLYIKKILKNRNKNEKNVFLTFNSNLQHSLSLLAVKKIYPDIILCDIIGDLHGKYGIKNPTKGLKGKIINKMEELQDKLARQFDCFVFVTKHMAEALKVTDKPYTVMECLYKAVDNVNFLYQNEESELKYIFNAGNLSYEYGIEHLLNSFSLIKDENYRLLIAGSGNAVDTIKEYEKRDSRIKYLGFITPKEVENYQKQSTVLVNPRTSEFEFVKYSFASKNMECLASGKPYIAHKLLCNPPEYDEYIQYPNSETDEDLKNKIINICEMSKEERDEIGIKSRNFIINEKNCKIQCKKVLDMLKDRFC